MNELATVQNNMMQATAGAQYSSFVPTTKEDKALLFNAMSNPDKALGDCINISINIKHILAEEVELTNEQTGELEPAARVVIIDDKGVSYNTVSKGIFGDVKRLIASFGEPGEWEKPIKVTVRQKQIKQGKMLKLELAK